MFDAVIRWSLNNRLTVIVVFVLAMAAAIAAATRMAIDVFPEFAPPQVQIQTEAPGYAAKDVELLVTRPLEVVLQGSPLVEQIRSNSSIGLSRITLVFKWNVDVYRARVIVQERLQLAQAQLPAGIEPPQLMPVTSAVSWLLKFALVDWSDKFRAHELRGLVDWDFRHRLLAQAGVASTVAVGGGVKQYQVLPDPLKLQSYGLSFADVATAAGRAQALSPGAYIYPTPEEEYFARVNGQVRTLEDVRQAVVTVREGQPIFLSDVAAVQFGDEIKRGDGQIDGGPAIIGTVSKLWGADTLATTARVEATLRQLAATLPQDVQLIPDVFRQASFIEVSVDNLQQALLHASIIVALVLFLFLFRWRPTVISLIAIPTSLLMGVLVLWLLDVGINALTLGGLVFAIGEVVDDAIIDVENIVRRLRERAAEIPSGAAGGETAGASTLQIVYEGSREIRNSVVFATFVIVIAFLPIFFLEGIEGRIFGPLAIAYLAAIGSSLVVAITLVPVLCYYVLARDRHPRAFALAPASEWLGRHYRAGLTRCLRVPRLLIAAAVAAAIAAVIGVFFIGRAFIPAFQEGNIVVATTLMPGTSLEENLRVGRWVQQRLGAMPEVALIAQRAGRSRLDEDAQPVNFSEFDVTLKPGTRDIPATMQRMRAALAEVPGMAVNVSQFITHRMHEILSGVRAQVAVKIYGPDLAVLQQKQTEIMNAVKDIAGVVDLQAEPLILSPGVDVRVNRRAAAAHGFTAEDIVTQAGQALNGVRAAQILELDRAFDLFVRIPVQARDSLARIGQLPLRSPSGAIVPLRAVADVVAVQEPYMINRDGGARRAAVQWNVVDADLVEVVGEAQARIAKVSLPPGYSLEFGGDYVGQQRATRNLLLAGAAAVLAIFVAMLQAFKNARLAALVMANLPFALIGGVLALAIAGESLNVSSLIGLIVLFGIATRNSILLVSRYQQLLAAGMPPDEIALKGALDRLPPIVMTALSAGLAVIPLIVGDPAGKELERPLAIVLLGGMMSSTLLNLFILPAAFAHMLARNRDAVQRRLA